MYSRSDISENVGHVVFLSCDIYSIDEEGVHNS